MNLDADTARAIYLTRLRSASKNGNQPDAGSRNSYNFMPSTSRASNHRNASRVTSAASNAESSSPYKTTFREFESDQQFIQKHKNALEKIANKKEEFPRIASPEKFFQKSQERNKERAKNLSSEYNSPYLRRSSKISAKKSKSAASVRKVQNARNSTYDEVKVEHVTGRGNTNKQTNYAHSKSNGSEELNNQSTVPKLALLSQKNTIFPSNSPDESLKVPDYIARQIARARSKSVPLWFYGSKVNTCLSADLLKADGEHIRKYSNVSNTRVNREKMQLPRNEAEYYKDHESTSITDQNLFINSSNYDYSAKYDNLIEGGDNDKFASKNSLSSQIKSISGATATAKNSNSNNKHNISSYQANDVWGNDNYSEGLNVQPVNDLNNNVTDGVIDDKEVITGHKLINNDKQLRQNLRIDDFGEGNLEDEEEDGEADDGLGELQALDHRDLIITPLINHYYSTNANSLAKAHINNNKKQKDAKNKKKKMDRNLKGHQQGNEGNNNNSVSLPVLKSHASSTVSDKWGKLPSHQCNVNGLDPQFILEAQSIIRGDVTPEVESVISDTWENPMKTNRTLDSGGDVATTPKPHFQVLRTLPLETDLEKFLKYLTQSKKRSSHFTNSFHRYVPGMPNRKGGPISRPHQGGRSQDSSMFSSSNRTGSTVQGIVGQSQSVGGNQSNKTKSQLQDSVIRNGSVKRGKLHE